MQICSRVKGKQKLNRAQVRNEDLRQMRVQRVKKDDRKDAEQRNGKVEFAGARRSACPAPPQRVQEHAQRNGEQHFQHDKTVRMEKIKAFLSEQQFQDKIDGEKEEKDNRLPNRSCFFYYDFTSSSKMNDSMRYRRGLFLSAPDGGITTYGYRSFPYFMYLSITS